MRNLHQSARGLWRPLLVGVLFAAFTLAVYAALSRRASRITELVVEIQPTPTGLFFIQRQDVERRLDAGPQGVLIGENIEAVRLEPLERFLRRDPFVAEADLYTGYDGRLHVTIRQREPLLRVHHRRGPDYYLGPGGEVLPLSKHDVARVPVLTGDVPPFADAAADSLAIDAFALARRLGDDALLGALVEQIEVKDGVYTLVPKLGSAVVTLGTLEDLDDKLARLHTFLRGAVPEVGWDAYHSIDLTYDKQVVCRKKTTPSA